MKVAYLIEPPFNYLDETGAVTGCDIELARYVYDQLGINKVEFIETEFAQLLPGLARGDWQMTTGLFASPERQKNALFSRSIWALPDGLLVRAEDAHRIAGYRSLATAGDLKIAVICDQVQHRTGLDLGIAPDRFLVFETYANAARAVQDGTATAFASVARAHEGFIKQNHALSLAAVEVPVCEKPPAFGCFAFARTAKELRDDIDQALNHFIGAPEHRRLMRGYGFDGDDIDRLL